MQGEQQEEGNGCGHLEDNIEVALGDSLSLPASTLATAKSLRAIDALLLAKGVRCSPDNAFSIHGRSCVQGALQ